MSGGLAFVLDAQEHDDIGISQCGAEIVRNLDVERLEPSRYEGGGADDRDIDAQLGKRMDVRARDSAEENVSENDNLAAFQAAEFLPHGEHVEEGLGRMLVGAVTGIDDRNMEQPAQVERGTAGGMAQHDHVGVERLDILRGITESFPFGRTGGGGVKGDDIGAEKLGGHLKGNAGAGTGLEKEIHHRLAAERGDLLDLAVENATEGPGCSEDLLNLVLIELFDGEEVFSMPGHERMRVEFTREWSACWSRAR